MLTILAHPSACRMENLQKMRVDGFKVWNTVSAAKTGQNQIVPISRWLLVLLLHVFLQMKHRSDREAEKQGLPLMRIGMMERSKNCLDAERVCSVRRVYAHLEPNPLYKSQQRHLVMILLTWKDWVVFWDMPWTLEINYMSFEKRFECIGFFWPMKRLLCSCPGICSTCHHSIDSQTNVHCMGLYVFSSES